MYKNVYMCIFILKKKRKPYIDRDSNLCACITKYLCILYILIFVYMKYVYVYKLLRVYNSIYICIYI